MVCDNGPEFISRALEIWAEKHQVRLHFIEPGKPAPSCEGALVCANAKTSDYWQGDKAKWQRAFAEGKGSVFIDRPATTTAPPATSPRSRSRSSTAAARSARLPSAWR